MLAEQYGWQAISIVVTLAVAAMLPIVALLMPESPAQIGLAPLGAAMAVRPPPRQGNPVTVAMAALSRGVRSMDFWLLTLSFGICGFSTNGLINTHLIAYCADHGIAAVTGASVLAALGVFSLIGSTLSGWLCDRFNPRALLFWYYSLRGLSLIVVPFSEFDFVSLSIFSGQHNRDVCDAVVAGAQPNRQGLAIGAAITVKQPGDAQIDGKREQPDRPHHFRLRHGRGDGAVNRTSRHPEAEHSHHAALEQRGTGTPVQREADDGERDGVVGRIAQKIKRVGAQADRAGNHTRDDLDKEHRGIQPEGNPQNATVAAAGFCGLAIVIAAAHGDDLNFSEHFNMAMGSSDRHRKAPGLKATTANLARRIEVTPWRDQPIASFKIASSGPRPAQQPASLPSTTTLGRLRTPCCFALAAMWAWCMS